MADSDPYFGKIVDYKNDVDLTWSPYEHKKERADAKKSTIAQTSWTRGNTAELTPSAVAALNPKYNP